VQAHLFRDIFDNPFRRPSPLEPSLLKWNDGSIAKMAQAAYDDRDLPGGTLKPDRLLALAQALEATGYNDAEVRAHLKSEAPHYRGCWAVDLVLGKS
jgi:hypothetical protein